MTYDDVLHDVCRLVVDCLDLHVHIALDPDEPLQGGRYSLTSMSSLRLLTAIEDHFKIQFDDDEITPALLMTPSTLSHAVHTHLTKPTK
jgi:acyl carrier protein